MSFYIYRLYFGRYWNNFQWMCVRIVCADNWNDMNVERISHARFWLHSPYIHPFYLFMENLLMRIMCSIDNNDKLSLNTQRAISKFSCWIKFSDEPMSETNKQADTWTMHLHFNSVKYVTHTQSETHTFHNFSTVYSIHLG